MAEVPYSGTQSVLPETRVPDDFSHVRATPEQTGGLLARGEEALGQGATKASDQLFDISQFKDKINADDQVNYYITTHDKILYGDPDKSTLGPDGKPVPDTGFYGLQGRAASDARATVLKQLQDARLEGRANLKSPQAQLEYDQQTRRMYADSVQRTGLHADQQWKGWAGNVNEAGAAHSLNGFLRNLNDPEAMAHNARDYISFKVQAAQAKIGDDPAIKQRVEDEARRELLKAQVQYIGANDPLKAIGILDKNKETAGTEYEQLRLQLAARADAQTGNNIAQKYRPSAFQGAVGTAIARAGAVSGVPESLLTTVASIESGGDPASRTGSYKGLFNLSDEEFHKYGGGNIYDPFDNAMAAAKKLKAEAAAFQAQYGREPTAGDIYLIHNQGAAGYAAHLANPAAPAWQNMLSTGEGRQKGEAWAKAAIWGNIPDKYKAIFGNVNQVTSAQFVAMWQARANEGQFSSAGIASMKGTAYQMAMADPEFQGATPQAQQHALQRISQDFTAAQIAEDQTERTRKAEIDTAIGGYFTDYYNALHTPGADLVALVGRINNDPRLAAAGPQKAALIDRIRRNDPDEQRLGFGPGYNEAFATLSNDPNASAIQFADRKDITDAGYESLNRRFQATRRAPDKKANEVIASAFMKDAFTTMVHDRDIGTIKFPDAKGNHLYNTVFLPRFMRELSELEENAEKSGKPEDRKKLQEFLSPGSVQKMVDDIYPPNQRKQDQVTQEAGDPSAEAEPVPPPLPGVDAKAWDSLMAVRPVTANGKLGSAAKWAAALKLLRENPTEAMIADFDAKFGGRGFEASSALKQLGVAAPQQEPIVVPPEQQAAQASGRELHVTPQAPPPRPFGEPGWGLRAIESLTGGKKEAPKTLPEFGAERPNFIAPVRTQ